MFRDLLYLPNLLDRETGTLLVVIETSKGRRTKIDLDARSGAFVVKSVLPGNLVFPTDFGFVPSTRGEDGDPVDVMLLSDEPGMAGLVVKARVLGVIEAEQIERDGRKVRNDRVLAASVESRIYQDVGDLIDVSPELIDCFQDFWVQKAEGEGKKFEILGVHGAKRAIETVAEGTCHLGQGKLD
jgi:inorganic pyrophosphatase